MSSKELELRHYVEIARSAIAPYYDAPPNDPRSKDARRQLALDALQRLDFGQDGYFFVYTMRGTSLMQPRQPDLVGRDLWLLRDPNGALTIQALINQASRGGYVRYVWRRLSTAKFAPKLGYVIPLERWCWMIGTGIYLEDVESTLSRIDGQAASNIDRKVMWIGAIALAALASIAVCAAVLNISEHRSADIKLKRLARQVVESQEQERAAVARIARRHQPDAGVGQAAARIGVVAFRTRPRAIPKRKPRSRRASAACPSSCAKCAASRTRCVGPCSTTSVLPRARTARARTRRTGRHRSEIRNGV